MTSVSGNFKRISAIALGWMFVGLGIAGLFLRRASALSRHSQEVLGIDGQAKGNCRELIVKAGAG